mmetsp:Transcript_111322/g.193201  ORF Transcript_111322/g.193201 Transcript_111322/m.193201 type:complete len:117 (-) Transcript_111322:321-671(-)
MFHQRIVALSRDETKLTSLNKESSTKNKKGRQREGLSPSHAPSEEKPRKISWLVPRVCWRKDQSTLGGRRLELATALQYHKKASTSAAQWVVSWAAYWTPDAPVGWVPNMVICSSL